MAKKAKWRNRPSICPQCKVEMERKSKLLKHHFRAVHGRVPSHGEIMQFMNYVNSKTPFTEGDFHKSKIEVSGGSFSPR